MRAYSLYALFQVVIQLFFVVTILVHFVDSGYFQDEMDAANGWRFSVAHDAKEADLSGASLASRVCEMDGTLSIAAQQGSLLEDLNAYLQPPQIPRSPHA